MKNITVSVDDETYREARRSAAERNVSVSALVRGFLESLKKEDAFAASLRRERELRAQVPAGFSAAAALEASREEINERSYGRD